jgi:5'(3')-deoxyribonucleotidase
VHNKIALIDVDGVLANIHGSLAEQMDCSFVHTWNSPQNSDEANNQLNHIKSRQSFWEEVPRIQTGFEIVSLVKSHGYEVHFVSGIPKCGGRALVGKLNWINRAFPGYPFHLTQDRSILKAHLLVDDGPDFVKPFMQKNPGTKVLMPQWDYNQEFLKSFATTEMIIGYDRNHFDFDRICDFLN